MLKKYIPYIYGTIVALASAPIYADLYCATGSQYIKVGMSESEVISACGKPQSTQSKNVQKINKSAVTQYVFQLGGVTAGTAGIEFTSTSSHTKTLIVGLSNNKIVAITLDGVSLPSTNACHQVIQVGDSKDSLFSSCGQPQSQSKTYQRSYSGKQAKESTWLYKFNPYEAKTTTLTFINGTLKSID